MILLHIFYCLHMVIWRGGSTISYVYIKAHFSVSGVYQNMNDIQLFIKDCSHGFHRSIKLHLTTFKQTTYLYAVVSFHFIQTFLKSSQGIQIRNCHNLISIHDLIEPDIVWHLFLVVILKEPDSPLKYGLSHVTQIQSPDIFNSNEYLALIV